MVIVKTKRVTLNNLKNSIFAAILEAEEQIRKDEIDADKFAKRLAEFAARSYRARVSSAPYNYRSLHPGPWSRRGGRPLEKSVIASKRAKSYTVYIENNGNVRKKGTFKPTEYAFLGAKKYLDRTSESILKNYKKIIGKIISNKR